MAVSYHKYGPLAEAYPKKVDAVASLLVRLARYVGTERIQEIASGLKREPGDGNTEWLMDVRNFSMIEFMRPRHPEAHFSPTTAAESPGRVWQPDEFDGTVEVSQRANDLSAAV